MASESKATKTPAKKKPETKSETKDTSAKDATAKPETKVDGAASDSGGEAAGDAPTSYSRGEGQKPVSPRYRSNWDNVFGARRRPSRQK